MGRQKIEKCLIGGKKRKCWCVCAERETLISVMKLHLKRLHISSLIYFFCSASAFSAAFLANFSFIAAASLQK